MSVRQLAFRAILAIMLGLTLFTAVGHTTYAYDGPLSHRVALSRLDARSTSRDGLCLARSAVLPFCLSRSLAAEGGARLAGRVGDLTGALDPIAQNSRTAVAMSTREGIDVLAGGARDLSPAQRALASGDDILGRLPGAHAEVTAMDAASQAGLTPWQMAVSRPICPACQAAIEGSGGSVAPGGLFAWWPW